MSPLNSENLSIFMKISPEDLNSSIKRKLSMYSAKKIRMISRKCLICGKTIKLKVYADGHYNKGHYFGTIKTPVGKGGYKKIKKVKIARRKADVVKWIGKRKETEYWECNECFEESSHESWLRETLEKLYGEKCKDYGKGCGCCQAWSIYDTIIEHNRGKL